MVLKRLKFSKFLMVWHERFPTHKHGCRNGAAIWKFQQKKAVFLVLSDKKQISPLLANIWKTF